MSYREFFTPWLKTFLNLVRQSNQDHSLYWSLSFSGRLFHLKTLAKGLPPWVCRIAQLSQVGLFLSKKNRFSQHFPNISKYADSTNFSSPVDLEYFQLIKDKIRTDALSVISYFQEMEKKDKIEKICNIGVTPSSIIMKTMNEI